MEWILIIAYFLCLLFIFLFSLGQLHLTIIYLLKNKKKKPATLPETLPKVTIQLPVYNEKYVVSRLIDAVCQLDYPIALLEVQVLDDSTDETVDIVAAKVVEYKAKGVDIHQIRRPHREGFKAGALAYGMKVAKGNLLAIFDADFVPNSDYLEKTIGYFSDKKIGCVQARWGHLNKNYSFLTQLQAFGLDAHFTVEQSGRNLSNSFINFNGTAGIWRKQCISDAGGWSADTLTEDLDLSYRAQLKGWKLRFVENVETPAELPVIMPAIKSQQYRWNKGAAETARKNLGQVLSSNLPIRTKIHACLHLLNSVIFLSIVLGATVSLPLLLLNQGHPAFHLMYELGRIFVFGFMAVSIFYFVATKAIVSQNILKYYFTRYPVFLIFSMGLSLHNAIAVTEGLLGKKTPFIRTPKFNINKKGEDWKDNQYVKSKLTWATLLEGVFCLYFTGGLLIGLLTGNHVLMLFHAMMAVGFAIVFYNSLKAYRHA